MAYSRFDFHTGNVVLAIAIGGLILGTVLYLRYFPESRMAQVFVSRQTVGEIGTEDPSLVNQTGETLTPLRPSGKALIVEFGGPLGGFAEAVGQHRRHGHEATTRLLADGHESVRRGR